MSEEEKIKEYCDKIGVSYDESDLVFMKATNVTIEDIKRWHYGAENKRDLIINQWRFGSITADERDEQLEKLRSDETNGA